MNSPRRFIFITAGIVVAAAAAFLFQPSTLVSERARTNQSNAELATAPNQRGEDLGRATPVEDQRNATDSPATEPPLHNSARLILAQGAVPVRVPERELFSSRWGKSEQPEIAAFTQWVTGYLAAAPNQRQGMIAQGVALAKARRRIMSELIKADPREAIANTPPNEVRSQLPTEIASQLEERISERGNVFRVMGLPQPGVEGAISAVDQARIGDRTFVAHRYGDRVLTPDLKDVSIHGVALDKDLAILDSPVRKLEPGETPAETTAECVVTDDKKVVTAGQDEASIESTVMLVGNHGYTLCCPFCSEDFETRMKRLEQQAMTAPQALQAISADANNPRALSSSGVSGTADFPGKPPTWMTHGAQSVIFLRVDFSDLAYPPGIDTSYLNAQVRDWDGLDPFFWRTSYGKTWIGTTDITPVLRMPHPASHYNTGTYWGDILNDAKAAAVAQGYNPDAYSCRIIVHENFVSGGAAGWGGGGAIWCNGNASKRLLIHEYGHVFWLPHANSWTSTDGNALSPGRQHVEYGDASDPMGNAWGTGKNNDFNAYYKSLCGWLPDGAVVPITHSGTYRINQFDGAADLTKTLALKITRENGLDLWVMFRGDSIAQSLYNQGAYVVGAPPDRAGDSHVLDFNNPSGDTNNAPLAQSQVWSDAASGITLTTAGRMMTDAPHYMYLKVDFSTSYIHAHRKLVHGGIYAFRNKLFNQYLDVPNNDPNPGALPRLWTFNGSPAQQWTVQRNSDGAYSFNHIGTDQYLDVAGNSGGDYAQITQWTWNGGNAQKWDVLDSWDGYLKFRHRTTDKVLTADTANSGDIIQYGDFSGEEQKWEPVLLGMSEGSYRIMPRHAGTFALGLRSRNGAAGTQVEQQAWEAGEWQCWTIQGVGDGQFRIYPQNKPDVTLAITNGSAKASLEAYTGTDSQKFTFTATDFGFVRITPVSAPAQCIEVDSSTSSSAGTNIQQSQYTGTSSQQFRFIDADL